MTVVQFCPIPDNGINDVLDDAFKSDYEEVLLFGVKKGSIVVHHSTTLSRTRLIGALEIAKHQLMKEIDL